MSDFDSVRKFERSVAAFFGAPYGICVDSCTHGIELCLRHTNATWLRCPHRTYLSIPMLANKLNIELTWENLDWENYYYLTNKIIDAAVLWKMDSYIPGTFMCISFQYQKHLSLGRGGIILCDDYAAAVQLKKMSYDGRMPGIPWREQDVDTMGYHYYMQPETAEIGLSKLYSAIKTEPRKWVITDWPDLTKMKIFKQ